MSRTAVLLVQEDGGETQAQSVEYVGQPLQWYKLVLERERPSSPSYPRYVSPTL